eukprot:SAG11_NODE_42966_length_172_cov_75.616438_1_plen_39_part_10
MDWLRVGRGREGMDARIMTSRQVTCILSLRLLPVFAVVL